MFCNHIFLLIVVPCVLKSCACNKTKISLEYFMLRWNKKRKTITPVQVQKEGKGKKKQLGVMM